MHVQYQKSQLNSHIDQDLQDALHFDEETLKVKLIRDIDPHYQNYEYLIKIMNILSKLLLKSSMSKAWKKLPMKIS